MLRNAFGVFSRLASHFTCAQICTGSLRSPCSGVCVCVCVCVRVRERSEYKEEEELVVGIYESGVSQVVKLGLLFAGGRVR
jgi:hypothetical protein